MYSLSWAMLKHVSEQKSCHDGLLNEVRTVHVIQYSFFYENREIPQGTRLTELEHAKALAYKDSGMNIHQISKTIRKSRKVILNLLRDQNYYVSKKKRGIRSKISQKA